MPKKEVYKTPKLAFNFYEMDTWMDGWMEKPF